MKWPAWLTALFARRTLAQVAAADLEEAELALYKALGRQEDVLLTVRHYEARVLRLRQYVAERQSSSLPDIETVTLLHKLNGGIS